MYLCNILIVLLCCVHDCLISVCALWFPHSDALYEQETDLYSSASSQDGCGSNTETHAFEFKDKSSLIVGDRPNTTNPKYRYQQPGDTAYKTSKVTKVNNSGMTDDLENCTRSRDHVLSSDSGVEEEDHDHHDDDDVILAGAPSGVEQTVVEKLNLPLDGDVGDCEGEATCTQPQGARLV